MAGKRKYSLSALFLPLMFFCPLFRHVTNTVSNKPTECESAGDFLSLVYSQLPVALRLNWRRRTVRCSGDTLAVCSRSCLQSVRMASDVACVLMRSCRSGGLRQRETAQP